MLMDILPATKAKMKILNTIYNHKGANIRNIMKLSKASPNLVVDYVNKLEEYGIADVKKFGGNKKKYMKSVSFNFKSKLFYSIIEINKKDELLKRYSFLNPFATQIENMEDKNIWLIYGSYARFAADKGSDLDIWIIGNADEKLKKRIEELLVTCPAEYSITIEKKDKFMKKMNDSIHQNILKDKVIIKNEERFFEIAKRNG